MPRVARGVDDVDQVGVPLELAHPHRPGGSPHAFFSMCSRAARQENDPRLARLLLVALVLKLMGACIRYAVAFNVYSGEADAKAYDKAGGLLAAEHADLQPLAFDA